jgi:hypothetical protein
VGAEQRIVMVVAERGCWPVPDRGVRALLTLLAGKLHSGCGRSERNA